MRVVAPHSLQGLQGPPSLPGPAGSQPRVRCRPVSSLKLLLARLQALVIVALAALSLLPASAAPLPPWLVAAQNGSASNAVASLAALFEETLSAGEHSELHSFIDSCAEHGRGKHLSACSQAFQRLVTEAQLQQRHHEHRRPLAGAAGRYRSRIVGVGVAVSKGSGRNRRQSEASRELGEQVEGGQANESGSTVSAWWQSDRPSGIIHAPAPLATSSTSALTSASPNCAQEPAAAATSVVPAGGPISDDLMELLAQFYAHTQEIQDRVDHYYNIQLTQIHLNRLRRRQQLLQKALQPHQPSNVSAQVDDDDIYDFISASGSGHSNNTEQTFEREKFKALIEKLTSGDYEKSEEGIRLRELDSFIKMKLGADDESLLRWLRQRQDQFSSLKNATFELLKETPNRTINVCPDGPKILVLPNVTSIVHCYTHDQWVEKMWDDLRLFNPFHYPIMMLNILIFLFGTTGNVFVCLSVYRNHNLRNVTNYFIVNLALADFLVILICLPATVVWDMSLTWFFGTTSCKLIMFLQDVSISVSVLTLTAISIDRYYAICHPLKFKSNLGQAKKIIAFIWLASLITMLPDLIYLSAKASEELKEAGLDTVLYSDCNYDWGDRSSRLFQFVKTILLYLIPFILMICAHYNIMKTLYATSMSEHIDLSEFSGRQQQVEEVEMHNIHQPSPQPTCSRYLDSPMSTNLEATHVTDWGCQEGPRKSLRPRRLLEEDEDEYEEYEGANAATSRSMASPSPGLSPLPPLVGSSASGRDSQIGHAARLIRFQRADELSSVDLDIEMDLITPAPETGAQESAGKRVEPTGSARLPTPLQAVSHAKLVKGGLARAVSGVVCARWFRGENSSRASSSNYWTSTAPDNSGQVIPGTRTPSGMQTLSSRASVCSYQVNVNDNQHSVLRTTTGGSNQDFFMTIHNKRKLESRRAAAKMLVTITVLFGICYLPVHLINFLRQFVDNIPQTDMTSTFSMLAHCFCYLNSAINPIIYNHMNSIFRAEFRKFIATICCRRPQNENNNVRPKEIASAATGTLQRPSASKINSGTTKNNASTTKAPRGQSPVAADTFDIGSHDRHQKRQQAKGRFQNQIASKS